ncbi:arylesterase [Luminiphilus syltensis NOR5-1B]|uniref:Arylesterase n=1 Tax=Luminiphilus syltensis NOR5-1B TaxID=565045 RepID=B8KS85_9GAMM|nr:arylesterase [Luminiphilus syltensis]EED35705.1 arylesterase [Luminiphilus syltensis NOR5-1B]
MRAFLRTVLRPLLLGGLFLAAMANTAADDRPVLLLLGDSISAAYGMDLEQGWASLLQQRLNTEGYSLRVANASISGETTAGGRRRIEQLLVKHRPALVIVELGGNDALRGYPITQLRNNLRDMVTKSQNAGAAVLLLAMEAPPNFGARYTSAFRDSFSKVAAQTDARVSDFMLEGIALEAGMMQADGIHPTISAQPRLLDNVWSSLQPMLEPFATQP